MPLFKSNSPNRQPVEPVQHVEEPGRRGGFFSSRRSPSPTPQQAAVDNTGGTQHHTGLFGRRASRSSHSPPRNMTNDQQSINSVKSSSSRSFFSFRGNDNNEFAQDPSILAARKKVTDAEGAERAADEALIHARRRVGEAKNHVKQLEQDALHEARRARARQAEAKILSKSARGLGRHGTMTV